MLWDRGARDPLPDEYLFLLFFYFHRVSILSLLSPNLSLNIKWNNIPKAAMQRR